MKFKVANIGIVGLGQIGGRLYKEILSKKNNIKIKTGVSLELEIKIIGDEK